MKSILSKDSFVFAKVRIHALSVIFVICARRLVAAVAMSLFVIQCASIAALADGSSAVSLAEKAAADAAAATAANAKADADATLAANADAALADAAANAEQANDAVEAAKAEQSAGGRSLSLPGALALKRAADLALTKATAAAQTAHATAQKSAAAASAASSVAASSKAAADAYTAAHPSVPATTTPSVPSSPASLAEKAAADAAAATVANAKADADAKLATNADAALADAAANAEQANDAVEAAKAEQSAGGRSLSLPGALALKRAADLALTKASAAAQTAHDTAQKSAAAAAVAASAAASSKAAADAYAVAHPSMPATTTPSVPSSHHGSDLAAEQNAAGQGSRALRDFPSIAGLVRKSYDSSQRESSENLNTNYTSKLSPNDVASAYEVQLKNAEWNEIDRSESGDAASSTLFVRRQWKRLSETADIRITQTKTNGSEIYLAIKLSRSGILASSAADLEGISIAVASANGSPNDQGDRDPLNLPRIANSVRKSYTASGSAQSPREEAVYRAKVTLEQAEAFFVNHLSQADWEETARHEIGDAEDASHKVTLFMKLGGRSVTIDLKEIQLRVIEITVRSEG